MVTCLASFICSLPEQVHYDPHLGAWCGGVGVTIQIRGAVLVLAEDPQGPSEGRFHSLHSYRGSQARGLGKGGGGLLGWGSLPVTGEGGHQVFTLSSSCHLLCACGEQSLDDGTESVPKMPGFRPIP